MENIEAQIKALSIDENAEVQWLQNEVLGKDLKIILNDHREITGKLQCVDHLANIVLTNTSELIPQINVTRQLGNIIIPAKGISKILLQSINNT